MTTGYTESELVANRTAVLLWGGDEDSRRAWAEEAAANFPADGPLRVVADEGGLETALHHPRGVVLLTNGAALSHAAQLTVVRCLREREERPKIVVCLPGTLAHAVDKGLLRPDLDFALLLGRVDLSSPPVRESVKARRSKAAKARPAKKRAEKKTQRRR